MGSTVDIGALRGQIILEDLFTSVLSLVDDKIQEFGKTFEGTAKSIKEGINDPIGFAKSTVNDFLDTLGPVGVGIGVVATGAAVLGGEMYHLADQAADAGEQVLNFTRITGESVDNVGAFAAAATIGGSSLDGLQGMLFQVQRRMDATGASSDKFNSALSDLGLSATAFRAADPSDRVDMLSTAMHNAAGNTNLMSDAIAVMGRGAMQNMPLLLKNFDDLEQRGEELGYTWTTVAENDAEQFKEASAGLGVSLTTVATTIGVALLPAMTLLVDGSTRTVQALEHIADLGGLVSGAWNMIKGAVGETALQEQSALAVQDSVNRMWAQAATEGLNLKDATYQVADQMLAMGYNVKTVAEQTGLSVEAVKELDAEMKEANKSQEAYAASWDRVNTALNGGTDISQVDDAMRGLVKDMLDAHVKMEDIVETTSLSVGQIDALKTSIKAAETEQTAFTKAWANLNTLTGNYRDTLAELDPVIQKQITDYAALGASVGDLVKAFPGLTQAQAEAAKAYVAAENAGASTLSDLWQSFFKTKADLEDNDKDKIVANAEFEYEAHVKTLQNEGVTDVTYYSQLWDLRQKTIDMQTDAYNKEQAAHQKSLSNIGETKTATSQFSTMVESVASGWTAVSNGVNATKVGVTLLDGEMVSLAEAQKRFDQGSSFTYDLSTTQGIAQYRQMNPAAQISWSDNQIMDYIKKGGTLQGLIQTGVINPYGNMGGTGFAEGGTVDVTVGERGREVVRVPLGSQVIPNNLLGGGGDTFNTILNVNGTPQQAAKQAAQVLLDKLKTRKKFAANQ